jgi:HlyD family secretion protein
MMFHICNAYHQTAQYLICTFTTSSSFMLRYYGFLWMFLFLTSCKSEQEQIKPTLTAVTESVYASGNIKSEDQYMVYASVSGILKQVLVTEGQLVKKGQPLFVVENKMPELNVENARLALDLAKENYQGGAARLKELELQISLAKEKMALDSLQFARQFNLWAQKIGTEQELDIKRVNFESSRNNYLALLQQYQQVSLNLKNEWQRAQNNYKISLQTKGDFTVKSEIDGRIYLLNKQKGEQISPQEYLAVLGSATQYVIELQVDEYDIVRVKEGQPVKVAMDSYKGQVFDARISRILPVMSERGRTFTVEAVFDRQPEVLYPNLTVEASIVIRVKDKALTIPRSYLLETNEVIMQDNVRRKVTTGLSDLQKIEILSGLDTSDIILKP